MAATLNRVIMTMAIVTIRYREGGEGCCCSAAAVIRVTGIVSFFFLHKEECSLYNVRPVESNQNTFFIIYLWVGKRNECSITLLPSSVFASILNA